MNEEMERRKRRVNGGCETRPFSRDEKVGFEFTRNKFF